MSTIATGFERTAAPRRSDRTNDTRRVLRALRDALDRLVPPADDNPPGPPPEWFRYPPM